jgi:O6-methylguanine-DNA--protein-cysteine methyltransferase
VFLMVEDACWGNSLPLLLSCHRFLCGNT